MADKQIQDFDTLDSLKDDDFLLVASDEETYNVEFSTLKNEIIESAESTINTADSEIFILGVPYESGAAVLEEGTEVTLSSELPLNQIYQLCRKNKKVCFIVPYQSSGNSMGLVFSIVDYDTTGRMELCAIRGNELMSVRLISNPGNHRGTLHITSLTSSSGGGQSSSEVPVYTIEWLNENSLTPAETASKKATNKAVLDAINGEDPGTYQLFLKRGNAYIPANYVNGTTVSFIEAYTSDNLTVYFAGVRSNTYVQDSCNYPETTTFDETSNATASMSLIAEYVDDKLDELAALIEAL